MNTFEKLEIIAWSLPDTAVKVERRTDRHGFHRWAVCKYGSVLNKQSEWEFEPQPSGRTDDFLARTRFVSVQEACDYIDKIPAPATDNP